ncbi:hypothetical protein WJX81_002359 [Elliptochloris bilobata]|uniref:ATP adenylyltransferase n=1 Tax=Elliptochloris bilobata TaxID=381761 RepID=A0AAW1S1S6_9CHLO
MRAHTQVGAARAAASTAGSMATGNEVDTTAKEPSQQALWQRIEATYSSAEARGAAYRTDTLVRVLRDLQDPRLRFVLRVATALRDKPKPPKASGQEGRPAVNPFLPYEEALWVAHLSPSHTLLLNKFNVVAHHLLVVTRAFEPQGTPLSAGDLSATWRVMQAMPHGGLAYFNCGEHSGASQPHKHTQIVPLPLAAVPPLLEAAADEATRGAGAAAWEPRAARALPFRCFCAALPEQEGAVTGKALAGAFQALHAAAFRDVCGEGSPSFNVLLTQRHMALVPRSREAWGPVAVNSMGYAGSLLVRSREELEYIEAEGPLCILTEVGQPW